MTVTNKSGFKSQRLFLFFIIIVLFSFNAVFSQDINLISSNDNLVNLSNNVVINYYYLPTCPHCLKVLASGILENLSNKYDVTLNKIDANKGSSSFLNTIGIYSKTNSDIQYGGVPFLVVYSGDIKNGIALQGDESIINDLEKSIQNVIKKNENTSLNSNTSDSNINDSVTNKVSASLKKTSFIYLFITAFADSINPCIMSILALLLIQLSVSTNKKKSVKLSFVYIAVVFFSYLTIGLLLYKGVDIVTKLIPYNSFGFYINVFVFLLLVVGAIINIKDAFFYGKGFSFSLPSFVKPKVEKLVKEISFVAIITLALIVTVVEFPCSGLMYVGLISLLINAKLNFLTLLTYLIIYNIIFVLPLILMVISVLYFKESASRVDAFRIKYRKLFRLVMGVAMLLLAIYLFRTFISFYLNVHF